MTESKVEPKIVFHFRNEGRVAREVDGTIVGSSRDHVAIPFTLWVVRIGPRVVHGYGCTDVCNALHGKTVALHHACVIDSLHSGKIRIKINIP